MSKFFECLLIASVFIFGKVVSQATEDVNGDWGEWSPCSRSCGVGVMYHNRKCLDVTDGGVACPEPRRQYRTCNIQDCPEGSGDFRYEQCARYNNKTLQGKKYKWVPYIPERDVCGLNCMPKGEHFYSHWADKVVDGTRCRPESYDICVNGKCESVGCDLIINSTAKEDKCRVCNGNGENCRTITGKYTSAGGGYKEFLVIPSSATNILITESNYLGHFLAVADEKGNYFFNGNYEISNPKTFKIAGSLFRYERSSEGLETIRSLGPTTAPVHAVALLRSDGENPSIQYEFSVPKTVKVLPQLAKYKWKTSDYGSCSKSCAGGRQVRDVYCVRDRDQKVAGSTECDPTTRPENSRRCNTHSCEPRWFISGWGSCSVTCGRGVQVRRVHCEHIVMGGETVMIPDDRCTSPKPISKRRCVEQDYCPTWTSSRWSQCSASCGEGQVTRDVTCQDVHGNVVPVSSCDERTRPKNTDRCNPGPCSIKWTASKWSECYPRCGDGISTRMVYCVSAVDEKQKYPSTLCNNSTKPVSSKRCSNEGSCAALWHGSQWSRCTSSCGTGMQMRNVICAIQEKGILRIVPRNQCNASYVMPTIRKCTNKPCIARWYIHAWKPCSKSCGVGVTSRDVTCIADGTVVPDERWCDKETKPIQFNVCLVQNCGNIAGPTPRTQTVATRARITVGDPGITNAAPTTTAPTTTEKATQATTTETFTTPDVITEKTVVTDAKTTETATEKSTTQTATTAAQTTPEQVTTETLTTETPTTQKRKTTQEATTKTPTTKQAATQKPITTQEVIVETKAVTEEVTTTQAPTTHKATTQKPTTTQAVTTETPTTTQEATTEVPKTTQTVTETSVTQEPSTTTTKTLITEEAVTQAAQAETEVTTEQAATSQPAFTETVQKMTEKIVTTLRQIFTDKRTEKITENIKPTTTPTSRIRVTRKPVTEYIPIVPVKIVQEPKDIVTYKDSEVLMRCRATGSPSPKITWRKEMMPISLLGERFKVLEDGTLKVVRVTSQDEETYTCFATNFVTPMVNASAKLTVVVPVVVSVDPANNADLTVGDQLVLKCEARGRPTPTITWYKDGQIVSLSGQGTSHTLNIKSAGLENSGTYECRASNKYSQDSAIVLINVKGEVPTPAGPKTEQLCTDNNSLANCGLAKRIGFCNNKWYMRACCITCGGI